MPIKIGAKPSPDFSNPIELLIDCHRRIERFLAVLLKVAADAKGGAMTQQQRREWEQALDYFRNAAPRHQRPERSGQGVACPSVTETLDDPSLRPAPPLLLAPSHHADQAPGPRQHEPRPVKLHCPNPAQHRLQVRLGLLSQTLGNRSNVPPLLQMTLYLFD